MTEKKKKDKQEQEKGNKSVNGKNTFVNKPAADSNEVTNDNKSVKKENAVSHKQPVIAKKKFNFKKFFSLKICGITTLIVWFGIMSYYVFTLMQFKSTIMVSLQKIDQRLELSYEKQLKLNDIINENLTNVEELNDKISSQLDGASDERKALYRKITQLGSDKTEDLSDAKEEAIFGKEIDKKKSGKNNRSYQKRYINKKNEAVIKNFMGFMKSSGKSIYSFSKDLLGKAKEKAGKLSEQLKR